MERSNYTELNFKIPIESDSYIKDSDYVTLTMERRFVLNKCEINYFKNNIFTFGNPICYKNGIKIDNEIFDLYQYYSLNSL